MFIYSVYIKNFKNNKWSTQWCLCIAFSLELGEEGGLAGGDLGLALLEGEFGQIPALLGCLLLAFNLLVGGIGADGGVGFLVDLLQLKLCTEIG